MPARRVVLRQNSPKGTNARNCVRGGSRARPLPQEPDPTERLRSTSSGASVLSLARSRHGSRGRRGVLVERPAPNSQLHSSALHPSASLRADRASRGLERRRRSVRLVASELRVSRRLRGHRQITKPVAHARLLEHIRVARTPDHAVFSHRLVWFERRRRTPASAARDARHRLNFGDRPYSPSSALGVAHDVQRLFASDYSPPGKPRQGRERSVAHINRGCSQFVTTCGCVSCGDAPRPRARVRPRPCEFRPARGLSPPSARRRCAPGRLPPRAPPRPAPPAGAADRR